MNRAIRALSISLCAALSLLALSVSGPAGAGTDRGIGRAHAHRAADWGKRAHAGFRGESTERLNNARLADVTADAWRWYLSLPMGIANDTGGSNCGVNQQGDFWFLGGPVGETYDTTCTIPFGKTIVVFVANYVANDCVGDFHTDPVPNAREFLGAFATEVVDSLIGPGAELNHQPLRIRRVATGVFPFTAHASWSDIPDGCFTGSPQIAVADGYWAVIPPLPRGDHTLTLTLADPATAGTFTLRIR